MAIGRHAYVARLEIAMDDAAGVTGRKPLEKLRTEPGDLTLVVCARRDPVGQRLARDVFHHEQISVTDRLEIVDRGDVGVVETRQRQRLLPKPAARLLVAEQAGRQHLDRDLAVQPFVLGQVDFAHPACADQRNDFVVAERGSDERRQVRHRTAHRR